MKISPYLYKMMNGLKMKQIDVEKRRFTDSQPSLPLDAASVVSVRPGGSLTGQYGGEVELHCEGAGSPSPNLSWQQTSARGVAGRCAVHQNHICHIFLEYVLYASSNRGVGGRLTLSGLQYEDQGEYTCLAENSVGRERSPPVSLSVIGPPRVALAHIGGVQLLEGGDAVLEVEWCAAPFPRQVLTKIQLLRAHNLPLEMKGCL